MATVYREKGQTLDELIARFKEKCHKEGIQGELRKRERDNGGKRKRRR